MRRPKISEACLALWLVLAIVGAWPGPQAPKLLNDSEEYLRHAANRPPVYPMFLHVLGSGPGLCWAQVALAVCAFAFMGFQLGGGVAGAAVAILPAITQPLYGYHLVVMTESPATSLFAALVGTTVWWMRKPAWRRFLAWLVLAGLFAGIRNVNGLLLPLFLLPQLLRCPKATVIPLLLSLGLVLAGRRNDESRYKTDVLAQLYAFRLLPTESGRTLAKEKGLPWSPGVGALYERGWRLHVYQAERKEQVIADTRAEAAYDAWLAEKGAAVYARWLLARPRSYWEPLLGLRHGLEWTWDHAQGQSIPRMVSGLTWRFAFLSRVPWVLLLVPSLWMAWDLRRGGRRSRDPEWRMAATLPLIVYAFAFLNVHGHPGDVSRYVLPARSLVMVLVPLNLMAGFAAFRKSRPSESGKSPPKSS